MHDGSVDETDGKMAVEYSNNVNATDVRFLGRVAEIGVKKGKRLPTYFQPYRLGKEKWW